MKISSCRVGALLMALSGLAVLTAPASGDTVQVNEFELYYETAGQGQPLLLLHGITQVGAEWDPIKDELASQFRLIIPDLRGHGSSTNPSGQFTHRQSALDMFALLNHLEMERVQAIGFSTGGMTLLHMATQQPERIDAMVLISTTTYFPEQAREVLRGAGPDALPEEDMQELRAIHKYGDDQIRALFTQLNAFKDIYDDMNFTPPYLSTISARTLIVHGDRDAFFPANIALEMYQSIPHAFLWLVPNGGHVPIFGPVQEHFVCTATGFLTDEWRAGGPGESAKLCD